MVRKFLRDVRGNYMIATAIAMVPIMGALALAIDFTEMNRERQATLNALDAACVATGRQIAAGGTETELKVYAEDFFEANLGPVAPANADLTVTLPLTSAGGGTLKCRADLVYHPYFYPAFTALMNASSDAEIDFSAQTEVRLKNTLEVALVLDNSGSMNEWGKGSGSRRIDLLKKAAKQLVDTIAKQGALVKQVNEPVRFALVPFSASVNVGPDNADKAWMDQYGVSPIHYENFDLPATVSSNRTIEFKDGYVRKTGGGWGGENNKIFTRFTLFDMLRRYQDEGNDKTRPFAEWGGCVETRPHPYDTNDFSPAVSTPESYFVPMFAPDEWDYEYDDEYHRSQFDWWNDRDLRDSWAARQRDIVKYFEIAPHWRKKPGAGKGPNYSCTTEPITPLTDVSTAVGLQKIKDAIDDMGPTGNTDVPEGTAWGWRVVSGGAPFTEGRPDNERGNDKVVIVLTDGANTYSGRGWDDFAGNESTYAALGYTGQDHATSGETRMFLGAKSGTSSYNDAMNQRMDRLCVNVKNANVLVMTVALDLDPDDKGQKKQIDALSACASESRFQKDKKLFWNTTGGDLEKTFKEIADELSNLRIVS